MSQLPAPQDDPRFQLGVISGKIDLVLLNLADQARRTEDRFDKAEARLDEHESRLEKHERDRNWVLGAAAAVGTAASAAFAFLGFGR